MKKILALCIFSILLSCNSNEVQNVNIKNQYSLELPDFLSKASNLHEDASLQYQNVLREFYVVVIDEPKQDFFDIATTTTDFSADFNGFHQILKSGLEEGIQKIEITPSKDTQINGLKAKTFSLTGEIETIPIYYEIAYIEGKDRFYQIVTWTLKDNKEKYSAQMRKILSSFKESGTARKSSGRSKN